MYENWIERDLLVLRAAVLLCDEAQSGSVVDVSGIAERTGFAIQDVGKAIDRLKHEHLIIQAGGGGNTIIRGATPLGLVVSGEWPQFTESMTELTQYLQELEKAEKDTGKKAIVTKTLKALGTVALQLGISVTANQIS